MSSKTTDRLGALQLPRICKSLFRLWLKPVVRNRVSKTSSRAKARDPFSTCPIIQGAERHWPPKRHTSTLEAASSDQAGDLGSVLQNWTRRLRKHLTWPLRRTPPPSPTRGTKVSRHVPPLRVLMMGCGQADVFVDKRSFDGLVRSAMAAVLFDDAD